MEENTISMRAKGMIANDMESHMRELYDIEISDSTISRITDKVLSIVKEWQERLQEEIYDVVLWMQSTIMCTTKGGSQNVRFTLQSGSELTWRDAKIFLQCMLVRMKVRNSGFPS